MIIHTLKMCCILNPFFTEMPTRRKKKVPAQGAVPPVQLSHQLYKFWFLFVYSMCVYIHINLFSYVCKIISVNGVWITNQRCCGLKRIVLPKNAGATQPDGPY